MADALELGTPGPMRDALVAAVLRGAKTATTCLLLEYEQDGEALPGAGTRQVLVDSAGRGVAEVEITHVEVVRLGEVEVSLAHDEGEGFASVAQWRAAHEAFWEAEVRPGIEPGRWRIDDATGVVVQHFALVAPPGDSSSARRGRR